MSSININEDVIEQSLPVWDVAIVGGGLSGLVSAFHLLEASSGLKIILFEASERIGGRLYSKNGFDLGGTWSWPDHDQRVIAIAKV